MKFAGKVEEAARFLRALQQAFDEGTKNRPGKYKLAFNVALSAPIREKSASEVKAFLSAVEKLVSQLPQGTKGIGLGVEIFQEGSFYDGMYEHTQKKYNVATELASPKIQQAKGVK